VKEKNDDVDDLTFIKTTMFSLYSLIFARITVTDGLIQTKNLQLEDNSLVFFFFILVNELLTRTREQKKKEIRARLESSDDAKKNAQDESIFYVFLAPTVSTHKINGQKKGKKKKRAYRISTIS